MIRKFGGSTGIDIQPQGLDLGIGSGSNIKSIQSGYANTGAAIKDITISSVNLSNSIVIIRETSPSSGYGVKTKMVAGVLTSSTNLRLLINTYNAATNPTVSWQVIEFNNVKSIQTGSYSVINAGSVTINSVNPLKSMVIASATSSGTSDTDQALQFSVFILNATTIKFNTSATDSEITAYWQVIEFN